MRKFFLSFLFLFLLMGNTCMAASDLYVNKATGYVVFIADTAELLTEKEEMELFAAMEPISNYGHVAFISIDYNPTTAANFAADNYTSLFGTESGTLFLIDMDTRYIRIHSDGEIYKTVTKGYANTITDNVYRLASNEKYDECAIEAFTQILDLLNGKSILQPMKYICNFFLALMLALTVNFAWMSHYTKVRRPKGTALLEGTHHYFTYGTSAFYHTHDTREESSGEYHGGVHSSGGVVRGGRSGGGGRGGRSGGGGGHRF